MRWKPVLGVMAGAVLSCDWHPFAYVGGAGGETNNAAGRGGGGATGTLAGTGGGGGMPLLELFVDPIRGSDSQAGTLQSPFRTIGKALGTLDNNTPSVIHLAAGIYSAATGEVFPYEITRGVTIQGPSSMEAQILGSKTTTAFQLRADTNVSNVRMSSFGTALTITAGSHNFNSVKVDNNLRSFLITEQAKVTVLNADISGGETTFSVDDAADLSVQNTKISKVGTCTGSGTGGPSGYGISAGGQSKVTLVNLTMEAIAGMAISLNDTASASLSQVTIDTAKGGCGSGLYQASASSIEASDLNILGNKANSQSQGISIADSSKLTITDGQISGSWYGLIGGWQGDAVDITLTRVTFVDNKYAAIVGAKDSTLHMESCTFENHESCVKLEDLKSAQINQNFFRKCGSYNLWLQGAAPFAVTLNANHFFHQETKENASGYGLMITWKGNATLQAGYNNWLPNHQGTDIRGEYPTGFTITGPTPDNPDTKNVRITDSSTVVKF